MTYLHLVPCITIGNSVFIQSLLKGNISNIYFKSPHLNRGLQISDTLPIGFLLKLLFNVLVNEHYCIITAYDWFVFTGCLPYAN